MPEDVLATMKVVLIGDSGVGKSSLMLRFTADTFDEDISATIGIDFKSKRVPVSGGGIVQLQLWDTAGQERFRTLTSSYYRGANAVLLVFDVNAPHSFEHLQRWLDEVEVSCGGSGLQNVAMMLIGNKVDEVGGLSNAALWPVPKADAVQFAREHGMQLAFCSAKTKEGVVEAFDEVARSAYDKLTKKGNVQRREGGGGVNLSDNRGGHSASGGGCC